MRIKEQYILTTKEKTSHRQGQNMLNAISVGRTHAYCEKHIANNLVWATIFLLFYQKTNKSKEVAIRFINGKIFVRYLHYQPSPLDE